MHAIGGVLIDFLAQFRHETMIINALTERTNGRQPAPAILHELWTDDSAQTAILKSLLNRASVSIRAQQNCPHARGLDLEVADGALLTIFLDHGLGA